MEQAAHCYINMEVPKVRKYAFHMILAGHRYSKSGQRKHALRSYSQALQVYKGKNWALAEVTVLYLVYMKESVDIANNEYKKKQSSDLYIITHVYKLHEEMCCTNCMYTR